MGGGEQVGPEEKKRWSSGDSDDVIEVLATLRWF